MEMKTYTFKPHKSNQSSYQPHLQVSSDIASRTQQWQAKKEEKLMIEKRKLEENENYTFKPETVFFIY